MELQRIADNLEAAGAALFAISYDSVETLAAFGAKHDITYPLLSDEGSRTIQRLGLLDTDLDRHHAEFGRGVRDDQRGVSYPAVFLLDRRGIVRQKRTHRNYRIRDTGSGLLETIFNLPAPAPVPTQVIPGEIVQIRGVLDSPTYRPYQQVQLTVALDIREGWHVYAAPVPRGYAPARIEVAPIEGVEVGRPVWPPGRRFQIAGLDEEFFVLDGSVRVRIPLTLSVPSPATDLSIHVAAQYQACSETTCLTPERVEAVLQIKAAAFPE